MTCDIKGCGGFVTHSMLIGKNRFGICDNHAQKARRLMAEFDHAILDFQLEWEEKLINLKEVIQSESNEGTHKDVGRDRTG